ADVRRPRAAKRPADVRKPRKKADAKRQQAARRPADAKRQQAAKRPADVRKPRKKADVKRQQAARRPVAGRKPARVGARRKPSASLQKIGTVENRPSIFYLCNARIGAWPWCSSTQWHAAK